MTMPMHTISSMPTKIVIAHKMAMIIHSISMRVVMPVTIMHSICAYAYDYCDCARVRCELLSFDRCVQIYCRFVRFKCDCDGYVSNC